MRRSGWIPTLPSPCFHNRGIVRQERGNPLEALDDFNEAIRLDSNFAQAYLSRGTSLAALGRHAEALIDWDQSLRLDPTLAKAYSNRGNARLHLGQIEQALADANGSDSSRSRVARLSSFRTVASTAMSDKWDEVRSITTNPSDSILTWPRPTSTAVTPAPCSRSTSRRLVISTKRSAFRLTLPWPSTAAARPMPLWKTIRMRLAISAKQSGSTQPSLNA